MGSLRKIGGPIIQGAAWAQQLEIGVDSFSHDLGGSENSGGQGKGLKSHPKHIFNFPATLHFRELGYQSANVHLCAGDNPLF